MPQDGNQRPEQGASEPNFEELDFLVSQALREVIHAREGGKCFYCRRRTSSRSRCLDHVVPRAKSRQDSYRNVVSCRVECNWQKKDHSAEDFLRELYREGRLPRKDLSGRLAASCASPPASCAQEFSVRTMQESLLVQNAVLGQLPHFDLLR